MKISVSWIIKFFISLGILFYIFGIIPFSEVIKSISFAYPGYIIMALLIIPLTSYITAFKMKILTDQQGLSLSLIQIIEINFITNFFGLFLPGSLTGGAIRWYKLSRKDNKPAGALVSIIFNRIIDTIILVLLGILFLAFYNPPNSNIIIKLSLITMIIGLIILYFIAFNRTVSFFLLNHLKAITFIPKILFGFIYELIICTSQYHYFPRKSLFYVLSFSLIWHLLGILSFYLFALSLRINISYADMGWIRSIILIINMLPVSFSGLGVREGTLIYLLGFYGISSINAVGLSFLIFAQNLLGGVVGGLFEARHQLFPDQGNRIN